MKKICVVFALFILFFAVSCDSGFKPYNPNDKNSDAYHGGDDADSTDDKDSADSGDSESDDADSHSDDDADSEPADTGTDSGSDSDTDSDTNSDDDTDASDSSDDSGDSESDDADSHSDDADSEPADTGSDSGSDSDADSDTNSDDDTDASDSDNDSGNSTSDEDNDTADSGSNNGEGDNTDTGSEQPEDKPCTEGDIRVGDTVCHDNPKGKLHQKCENGSWADIEGTCVLCDPGDYPKVCGTYAQKMWFTSISKLASIQQAEGWTRTYFLIVQEQEQEKVHIKATYCNIKIDNSMSSLLQIIIPQSFADALGTADKESVIVKNDDDTFGFNQDVFWELRGIDPACYGDNPAEYVLPTKDNYQDDPCVQDWDEDGNPGLFISAKGAMGGDMYMIEKTSSTIHDGFVSADGQKITALVDWTDKQEILWASTSTLESGSDNVQQNSSQQPGFTGPFNFIEQFKIPEESDCAYIVNNAATIFSPDPVVLR